MPTFTEAEEKTRRQETHTRRWTKRERPRHTTTGTGHPNSAGVKFTEDELAAIRQQEESPDPHPWD